MTSAGLERYSKQKHRFEAAQALLSAETRHSARGRALYALQATTRGNMRMDDKAHMAWCVVFMARVSCARFLDSTKLQNVLV